MTALNMRKREAVVGFTFAAPFLAGFVLFFVAPFIVSIGYTFMLGTSGKFVGLTNYANVLTSAAFKLSAWNTFRFILIGVPLIMAGSLLISLMVYEKFKGATFFRSVFLYPLVVPIASTVMVVQVFLSESGIVNTFLDSVGLPMRSWLNSEYSFYVLIGLYIWKNCGYNIVLFLAGLNAIPKDFYEAASLDGASSWQILRYIKMPILIPNFFFIFVISIINSFKCFREAYLLGGSMPNKSIYMLQHFMNNNFANLNYQRLSVAAFVTFVVIFAFIFLLFWLKRKNGNVEL